MNEEELKVMAKEGNLKIENAIIELLKIYKSGLTNTEIAKKLNLTSSHNGGQKDYLTYSVLGNLMERNIVQKDTTGSRPKYKVL